MHKRRMMAVFIVTSLFLLPLAGCGSRTTGREEAVKVTAVSEQIVAGKIRMTGVFDAQDSANLTAQIAGKVTSIGVQEGSPVKKGEIIISLDKSDIEAQLGQAQSNLLNSQAALDQAEIAYNSAQADYLRYKDLLAAEAISRQQFDQITEQRDLAKSKYESARGGGLSSAQQAVKVIELNLSKMDIRSPIDGIFTNKTVSVGDNVSPGASLGSVVSIDKLILTGNLPESIINYVMVGQQVKVTADADPTHTYTGKITFISPISITTGQYYPVKITVDNPGRVLKAGMTGSATISVQTQSQLAVPNTAIFQRDGQDYVFVVKDGKAVQTIIHVGLKGEQWSAISKGVKPGDPIVAGDTDWIMDGDSIKTTSGFSDTAI